MDTGFPSRCVLGGVCPFRRIPNCLQGGVRETMQSDIYNGYYIPKGLTYFCVHPLSTE